MHCPACGEEISEDSAFCQFCGEELSPKEGGPPESARSEKSSTEGGSDSSLLKRVGYWGGRLGQVSLVGFAGILIIGSFLGNMNIALG